MTNKIGKKPGEYSKLQTTWLATVADYLAGESKPPVKRLLDAAPLPDVVFAPFCQRIDPVETGMVVAGHSSQSFTSTERQVIINHQFHPTLPIDMNHFTGVSVGSSLDHLTIQDSGSLTLKLDSYMQDHFDRIGMVKVDIHQRPLLVTIDSLAQFHTPSTSEMLSRKHHALPIPAVTNLKANFKAKPAGLLQAMMQRVKP